MKKRHIILIGFKNVGKTSIGLQLASQLNRPFIDTDKDIEKFYQQGKIGTFSCREIMNLHGEFYFRNLESKILKLSVRNKKPFVIAIGGGALLLKENQELLAEHCIIHIEAPQRIVFERTMAQGLPVFLQKEEDSFSAFKKLWNERKPVFEQCAKFSVNNDGSIQEAAEKLKIILSLSDV